jgi:hypothetical protein
MIIPDFVKPELRFLLPRMLLCGAVAYILSGFLLKFSLSFSLGLSFGTICVLANILIIGIMTQKATMRGAKAAKMIMRISYFCRIIALGFCLWISFKVPWLNPIAFFITPAFVNIIYALQGAYDTLRDRRQTKRQV